MTRQEIVKALAQQFIQEMKDAREEPLTKTDIELMVTDDSFGNFIDAFEEEVVEETLKQVEESTEIPVAYHTEE